MNYDAVFHFDNDPALLLITINNIVNYYKALEKESFDVVLVVNGPGVQSLGKDNTDIAPKIAQIHRLGAHINVCQNALNHFSLSSDFLCSECDVVAAGIVEIVERQRKGYAYIKP